MIESGSDLKRCLDRLEAVASRREGYRERLEFFGRVLAYLVEGRNEAEPRPKALAADAACMRLAEGFTLLDRLRSVPEREYAGRIYDGLLELVSGEGRLPVEAVDSAARLRADAGEFEESLLKMYREPAAAPADEAGELAGFLLHCSLRPWLEVQALAYRELEVPASYDEGRCPVCGGSPAMGTLVGEEGKRLLLCHRCGFLWPFRRLKCPFCGLTDHERLRYLQSEEEPACRVDVCDACRGYLKVVDSRRIPGDFWLEAEDLVTPHFDLVAAREGYVRKAANVLGLFR